MMNEKHLVSLIVPCYNIAHVCDRFFDSLLRQTYTNIQLILVNDGSTDDTEKKLFSFKERLENKGYIFEYYYQENKGLGGAINTGLKKIKGEYFCWADSDDYYEDNAFEIRVKYFVCHPECNILTCNANVRESKDILRVVSHECDHFIHHQEPKQFQYLLDYESVFCPGAHMIRTDAFKTINPNMDIYEAKRGQDWQLLLPMYYYYDRHCLPDIVYDYVIYDNSMSHGDVDYEKKNIRIDENRTIQIETLKRIEMTEAERKGYFRHIDVFHDKLKMYNARAYSEKKEYSELYSKLKRQHEIDLQDRLRRVRFILLGR